jgi:hypothetical protein
VAYSCHNPQANKPSVVFYENPVNEDFLQNKKEPCENLPTSLVTPHANAARRDGRFRSVAFTQTTTSSGVLGARHACLPAEPFPFFLRSRTSPLYSLFINGQSSYTIHSRKFRLHTSIIGESSLTHARAPKFAS